MSKERDIIQQALEVMESNARTDGELLDTSRNCRDFCRLWIGDRDREHFGVILLNSRNRLIDRSVLFQGTIDRASVYPREVIRFALMGNAAAIILTHNHPSGIAEPSQSDLQITTQIKEAASLFEIRVLDHVVACSAQAVSFAERGLL